MLRKTMFTAIFISCLVLFGAAYACTDFQLKATDGSIVIGRSMEFAMGIDSDIVTYPKTNEVTSLAANGKKGIRWTPKYGYVGIDAFGEKMALLDGMNEAGLAVEFLWFTESQYAKAKNSNWLAITDLGHWLLGNFSTVSEVKKKIGQVTVVGAYVPQLKMVPGFHAAVHDAKGNNIVIEFINGETKVYDNPIGVMTNKPTFDWQLTNLRNYINLTPIDAEAKKIAGVNIAPAGSSSGWLGLPGDWTPPSRFVRTAMMVHTADPVKDAAAAVNLAEHILNANDIPMGVIKTATKINKAINKMMVDYTQWIVIKDLTNKVMYFRSYQDLALKKVDLKQLNLNQGAMVKTLHIEDGSKSILDKTDKLISQF